jgi:hypothetical protein
MCHPTILRCRFEQESFDISAATPPGDIIEALGDIASLVLAAAETVERHVFGFPPKLWMVDVANEMVHQDSLHYMLNLFWWQCVLDQTSIRAARLIYARARTLPAVRSRRRELMQEPEFTQFSFDAIARSNCIPPAEELACEADESDAESTARETSRSRSSSGARTRRPAASIEKAERVASSGRSPYPNGWCGTTAGDTSSKAMGPRVTSNGLRSVFLQLSKGYSSLFLRVVSVAARTGSHASTRGADQQIDRTRALSRSSQQHNSAINSHNATIMELTTHNSLRDRACGFMRAVLIEAVATMFCKVYQYSDSLNPGMLLHHTALRERIGRTADEFMFGALSPPGMLMWAPCTIGLPSPPTVPAPKVSNLTSDESMRPPAGVSLSSTRSTHRKDRLTTRPESRQGPQSLELISPLGLRRFSFVDPAEANLARELAVMDKPVNNPQHSLSVAQYQYTPHPALRTRTHVEGDPAANDWSVAIKEQLVNLLASLDSRTRLNLLMPTMAAADVAALVEPPPLENTTMPVSHDESAVQLVMSRESQASAVAAGAHAGFLRSLHGDGAGLGSGGQVPTIEIPATIDRPVSQQATSRLPTVGRTFAASQISGAPSPKKRVGAAMEKLESPGPRGVTSARAVARTSSNPILSKGSKWHLSSPDAISSSSEVRLRIRNEQRATDISATRRHEDLQHALTEHRRRNSLLELDPLQVGVVLDPSRPSRRASVSSVIQTLGPTGKDGSSLAATAATKAVAEFNLHRSASSKTVHGRTHDEKQELRALAQEFRASAVHDVPLASASFIYSPLIMASVGQRAGILGARVNAPAQGPHAFPQAARHAVTITITDAPAGVHNNIAGTRNDREELASRGMRTAIEKATGLAPRPQSRSAASRGASNYANPPTLNLFMMAQMQQCQYDTRTHVVRSHSALEILAPPNRSTLTRSNTESALLHATVKEAEVKPQHNANRRRSSVWRVPASSPVDRIELRGMEPFESTTFITGLSLEEPEAAPAQSHQPSLPTSEEPLPPIDFPIVLFGNIDVLELLDAKRTNKPLAEKSNMEVEYGISAASLAASASVPNLTSIGSKRTLSSISNLASAAMFEDKLHQALQEFTSNSLLREEELLQSFRALEGTTRQAIRTSDQTTRKTLKVLKQQQDEILSDDKKTSTVAAKICNKRVQDFLHLKADIALSGMPKSATTAAQLVPLADVDEAAALGLSEEDINRIQADALKLMQDGKKLGSRGMTPSLSAPALGLSNRDTLRRLTRETRAAVLTSKDPTAASKATRAAIMRETLSDKQEEDESFSWISKYEGGGMREARQAREFEQREKAAREMEARRQTAFEEVSGSGGAIARLTTAILDTAEIDGSARDVQHKENRAVIADQLQSILRRKKYELGSTFEPSKRGVPMHKQHAGADDAAGKLARKLGVAPGDVILLKHSVDKRRLRDAILQQRRVQTDTLRAALSTKPKDAVALTDAFGMTAVDPETRLGNLQRVSSMISRSVPADATVYRPSMGSKLTDMILSACHDRDLMVFDTIGMEALDDMNSPFIAEAPAK